MVQSLLYQSVMCSVMLYSAENAMQTLSILFISFYISKELYSKM